MNAGRDSIDDYFSEDDTPRHAKTDIVDKGSNCLDTREKFAVKIIRARDEEYQNVALKEYHLLKSISHPGIIRMKDAFIN